MQKICCFDFLLSPNFYLHPCRLSDKPQKNRWQEKIVGAIVFAILSATIIFGIPFWVLAQRQVRYLNKCRLSQTDIKVKDISKEIIAKEPEEKNDTDLSSIVRKAFLEIFLENKFVVGADGYLKLAPAETPAVKPPIPAKPPRPPEIAIKPPKPPVKQKVHKKVKSNIINPEDLPSIQEKKKRVSKKLEKILQDPDKDKRKTYYVKVEPRSSIDETQEKFRYVNAELIQACAKRTKSVRNLLKEAKVETNDKT